MVQQTAVDWLVNKIYMVIPNEERNFLEGLREEALEKEKEQIIKAMTYSTYREWKGINVSNEQYYNETYNQNK